MLKISLGVDSHQPQEGTHMNSSSWTELLLVSLCSKILSSLYISGSSDSAGSSWPAPLAAASLVKDGFSGAPWLRRP
ncbi:hypothetical protein JTE90_004011 [Oedothorax gibbosus]|uniref:Uncharacterized protein n=1 Tax=Oedothorax gibbosus TaxID=931172 RepID=A0AAV6U4I6_9ARAC|nr:hypothetical protein JTE90_004011 [Oedothorax gibbosus]